MRKSEFERISVFKHALALNELRWETLAAKADGFDAVITSILDPAHIFITPIAFLEELADEKESRRLQRIDIWDFMANIVRYVQKSEDFFTIEQQQNVDWNQMIRKRKIFAVCLEDSSSTFYIRGRVISKFENINDGLIVLDIDSGMICRVPVHAITYLPDSIAQIPPLCFAVSPAELDFKQDRWEDTQNFMSLILPRYRTIVKIKPQDQEKFQSTHKISKISSQKFRNFIKYGSKCMSTKIASRYSTVDIMLTSKQQFLDRPLLHQPSQRIQEISLKSVLTSARPDLFCSCRANQSIAHQQPVIIGTAEAKHYYPLSVEFIPVSVENFKFNGSGSVMHYCSETLRLE